MHFLNEGEKMLQHTYPQSAEQQIENEGYSSTDLFMNRPPRWNEPETELVSMGELIRSNRELEQFAFAASHDLQEPLKIISLYLRILHRKYKGRLDDSADENISYILDRAEGMQKLIQSMLEYAQVGKGDIRFIKVDSGMVFNRAIENLRVSIEKNSAHIMFEDCPVILGDEIQLTQLFQNLINNAIKFSKKEEFPCIRISAKQTDNRWLFSIQDNGIGMKKEHLQNIFEAFRRLHPQSEYPGNGIGLALCKRIVESHRGNIWAESEIGKGTTIYFNIPQIQAVERANYE
jgi:light-regulated signal transduction histidine kinase (bacteriophytochrome)